MVLSSAKPRQREKYLKLVSRARYAINSSKHEAFSMFTTEALAIGTPAIVSKEIAENLEAHVKSPYKRPSYSRKAQIKIWNEIVQRYLHELY